MTWGFGDSEMDRYLPFCDIVEECRNLNQLYRVVDRLVVQLRPLPSSQAIARRTDSRLHLRISAIE